MSVNIRYSRILNETMEKGFSMFPHGLIEAIARNKKITNSDVKILLVIVRLTLGYQFECKRISYSTLQKYTNLPKDTVAKSVRRLEGQNIIKRTRPYGRSISMIRVNYD